MEKQYEHGQKNQSGNSQTCYNAIKKVYRKGKNNHLFSEKSTQPITSVIK